MTRAEIEQDPIAWIKDINQFLVNSFDQLDRKLDLHTGALASLTGKVDMLDTKVDRLDTRLAAVKRAQDTLGNDTVDIKNALSGYGSAIADIKVAMTEILRRLPTPEANASSTPSPTREVNDSAAALRETDDSPMLREGR